MLHDQQLVIATHNRGKLRELEALLQCLGVRLSCSADHAVPEPEETADSFAGNAQIKAVATMKHTGLPALADDSGLEVAALDGAPGVYSARWAGEEKDFTKAMGRVQRDLEGLGVAPNGAHARFVCHLTLAWPDGRMLDVEGYVQGRLCFPPRGSKGFGYDPIFVPEGESRSFAEMDGAEKERISHRAHAFCQLLDALRGY